MPPHRKLGKRDRALKIAPFLGQQALGGPFHSRTDVRAALYIRVSTREQAERWSLPVQRKILRALAKQRGWDAILYDEGGASAETIDGRPVLQRLLADVVAERIDLVAVIEMERLCRASDLRDWAAITTTFREAGVPVATPERIFNLSTAEDDFEADLRGILSKREKRKLLERTARGLNEARDAGRFVGGRPPLGYRFDHATRKIVPEPKMLGLVQRIFTSDLTPWKLSRKLREENIHLPYETIRRIRGNPFYRGLRPDSSGELISADWPAIIDEELWQGQQSQPQCASRRSSRKPGPAYLLSGILRCNTCGGPVVGAPIRPAKDGTKLYVYKCQRHCGQLTGWLVDMLVEDALNRYARDPAVLKERYLKTVHQSDDAFLKTQRAIRAKTQELEDRQDRLLDAVERGTLDDSIVTRRVRKIQGQLDTLRHQMTTLTTNRNIPSLPDLQSILGLSKTLDTAHRELLERLVDSVVLDAEHRRLVLNWRLGGTSRYHVPRFTGGPGRTMTCAVHHVRQNLASYYEPSP